MITTGKNIVLSIVIFALTGCGGMSKDLKVNNMNMTPPASATQGQLSYSEAELVEITDFPSDQIDLIGPRITKALRDGTARAFWLPSLPQELNGEMALKRMIFHAPVVDLKTGQEYFGQAVRFPVNKYRNEKGELMVEFRWALIVSVDKGIIEKDCKTLILSTMIIRAYNPADINGKGIVVSSDDYQKKPTYRKQLFSDHGINLSKLEKADEVIPIMKTWRRSVTPKGYRILTDKELFSKEEIEAYSRLYPGNDIGEKRYRYGAWTISTDIPGTILGFTVVDTINSYRGKPLGWQFGAEGRRIPNEKK